jgi:hypothetical protein
MFKEVTVPFEQVLVMLNYNLSDDIF